ncbi:bifunctional diguanylate cyclase/phosphodiesterase [Bradyrhizobium sp.]|uniref:bifunctional diguanylate cyclase/phosphodiesterase n=1 Tax=Bradyrhizobium sp. TaxID=376 RepID=UPI004037B541
MYQVLNCLGYEHDLRLVALAGLVCLLACAVAISLFHRARASRGPTRLKWMALDAVAAGCGIWATHFIAMLAYDPGHVAAYNIEISLLSLVFAIVTVAVGLAIALHDSRSITVAAGGAVVGLGVATMHYTGMLALEVPARIEWSAGHVAASILIGSMLAALALLVAARNDGFRSTSMATVLLTLAIVSHHFTAMGAVMLVPDPTRVAGALSIPPGILSFLTALASMVILGISMSAAMIDRRNKSELRKQQALLDSALENMSQGLCMFDAEGRIVLYNERYLGLMGLDPPPQEGQALVEVLELQKAAGQWKGDAAQYVGDLIEEMRAGRTVERVIVRTSRSIRVVHQPMPNGGWVATFEDITEWEKAQQQIHHMARHDALTNLPNRTLFRERLERALRLARRGDQLSAFCLDLDHFKDINDSLGHPVGDALLKEVARRLSGCLTEDDTVARLGGDEFAVVQFCRGCDPTAPSALASRMVEAVGAPYEIAGHQLVIGVSIGVSLSPDDGESPDQLLKNADLALYRAKADGRGTYRFFEAGMDARAQARRLLEIDLRAALRREEFEVHYQPIVDIVGDRTVAFEALVRWNHPERGRIAPSDFIPLAEETGLIASLGEWVLRQACTEAARWSEPVVLAVNLSPVQFKNASLTSAVMAALRDSGLPASRLELEITESVLLQNSEATLEILHELRAQGVRISLDDFGTGYSSLSYLRSFPFDKIKIDRSFVQELASREDSMAIVRAVAGLGRSLGIVTTAEGVETAEQLDLLRREGCNQAQGYLFSPPRPAAEVERMLSDGTQAAVA